MKISKAKRLKAGFMKREGIIFFSYFFSITFIWFGALKILGFSDSNALIAKTLPFLSSGLAILAVGCLEVLIGISLLIKPLMKLGPYIMMLYLFGTLSTLVTMPTLSWVSFPFVPSTLGQYVIKNLVLVCAAIVLGNQLKDL
ncbi:MAG: hypothetical protein NDI94_01850 [Candidatus Woesearchaeota archaeon]|nr:hypothetical protein [Candidatus Woesearchaeota archaeon]